ncbi:MAG: sigma 54-interacting transcriptional regulator [Deltaproteobacteria bacterium]|nr:sigma 54-interacting transcriptional regulator [Deltaproteobacteria bacterium]
MGKKIRKRGGDELPRSREHQELESLWEITQSLYQYLNVDDLIRHIVRQITEVMRAEAASVILYDEGKDELVFCWSSDIPERLDKLEEIRIPPDHGIAGSVFKSGKAEIILDVSMDPRHFSNVDTATKFNTKSMIAVPLKTKEQTIGVLEVLNKIKGEFDKKNLNFLVTLAPIIAMALDNARMCTELNRAYRELQLINKDKDELIAQTRNEVAFLRREVERHYRFDQIIGNSEPMLEVFRLCERVIDSDITVLVEGDTGTGKELIARTIHFNGPRKDNPFVSQNCGGIPDTLLASELFGHKRGSFTGAVKDKKGLFEIAHGGTVFLDEVGEMSPAMQTSLLRVLQEGEIKPLGSDLSKKVDVRIISATNKNLEKEVQEKRLREDLFYRLSVFAITLPPLRERVGDIPVLANHFVAKFKKKTKKPVKGLSKEALDALSAYPFPGNVRELENEIERAVAMVTDGNFIELSNLSDKIRDTSPAEIHGVPLRHSLREMVETLEKSVLVGKLREHRGNKTRIAKELGLSRNGLMKKMQRYGL